MPVSTWGLPLDVRKMKFSILILLLTPALQAEEFRMKTPPDALAIVTPTGEKTIVFDPGSEERPKSYRIQIPVADLRPPPPTPNPSVVPETSMAPTNPVPPVVEASPTPTPNSIATAELEKADRRAASLPPEEPLGVAQYDDSDRLILEANHLFNRGDYFSATVKVDELLKRNPKLTRGWVMKGTLFYVQGFKDLAKNAWEKAYSLSEQDKQVKRLLEKVK